jgi:hypothetical protein
MTMLTERSNDMALASPRRRATRRQPARPAPKPPPNWPVDPDLTRRVIAARARLERTRRELARHVLPERQGGAHEGREPR